jgi:hypothetical protein
VGDQTLAIGSKPPSGQLNPWLSVAGASLGRSLLSTTWGNTCHKSATNFRHINIFGAATCKFCFLSKKFNDFAKKQGVSKLLAPPS